MHAGKETWSPTAAQQRYTSQIAQIAQSKVHKQAHLADNMAAELSKLCCRSTMENSSIAKDQDTHACIIPQPPWYAVYVHNTRAVHQIPIIVQLKASCVY
jgi:hypothetical protein